MADDREEFANAERFPNAQKILLCPPDQAIRPENLTPRTYIIIVTRGHALDQECLEAALQTSVPYIGMIGSMKKVPLTWIRGFMTPMATACPIRQTTTPSSRIPSPM